VRHPREARLPFLETRESLLSGADGADGGPGAPIQAGEEASRSSLIPPGGGLAPTAATPASPASAVASPTRSRYTKAVGSMTMAALGHCGCVITACQNEARRIVHSQHEQLPGLPTQAPEASRRMP
jgi:hypothetical protein